MNKYYQYIIASSIGTVLCCATASAFARSETQIGRYLQVSHQAKTDQTHLLIQTMQFRFPTSVSTIKDAVKFVLQFSGYSLVPTAQQPLALQAVLTQPLPEIDRMLGPVSLKNALLTLVGHVFELQLDPVHRLMSFQLKKPYQALYQIKHSQTSTPTIDSPSFPLSPAEERANGYL